MPAAPRPTRLFGRPILTLALAVFLGTLAIYLFTLSRSFSPDSMAFAVLATRGDLAQPLFFQAEHLLYPFAGWLWYQVWVLFGYRHGALTALQVLNAIFGAGGVAAFFLSLRLALGPTARASFISLVAALTLATSYGYWFHSTEGEDQIIGNAMALGAFLGLLAWTALRKQRPLPGGREGTAILAVVSLLAGLAVLFHATHVLFLPVLALGLYWGHARQREWTIFLLGLALVVAVPYILIGALVHGLRSPAAFVAWFLAAPSHGVWGQPGLRSLWQALQTLVGSLIYLQGGPSFRAVLQGVVYWRNGLAIVSFLAVLGGLLAVFGYVAYHRRRLAQGQILSLCAVWAGLYGAFNVYWAPEDIQFWVAVLPPLVLLASVACLHFLARHLAREDLLHSLSAFGLSVLFVVNFGTAMLPRARLDTNVGYARALCVGQIAKQGDLVVTPGWDWASSYVPYFTGREVFSLADVNQLVASGNRDRLVAALRERVEQTRRAGGKVYVVRLFALSEEDLGWLRRVAGLEPEDFPFAVRPTAQCPGEQVWEVVD